MAKTSRQHRVRKDPVTKAKDGWYSFRVYDEAGQEVRVDAKDEIDARTLATAWPGWRGKVTVERARQ